MQPFNHHSKRIHLPAIVAAMVCLTAGCWEEVYYTGSSAPPDPVPASPPTIAAFDNAGQAAGFGDELAATLTAQGGERAAVNAESRNTDSRYRDSFPVTPTAARPAESSPGAANTGITPTNERAPTTGHAADPMAMQPPILDPQAGLERQTPEAAAAEQAAKTRRAAWLLGSRWSLAELARERGAAEKDVADWLILARAQAQMLGTSLSELPPPAGGNETAAGTPSPTVKHLVAEGQRLGRDLTRFGPDHVALFELAVKSNLLLVLYEPGSRTTDALVDVITQSRERASLPQELSQPLLTAIAERREPALIRQTVFRLHDAVGRNLDAAAPR
ncbi:MAG: hypothetical protein WD669_04045 [Pirellulales bacterium]